MKVGNISFAPPCIKVPVEITIQAMTRAAFQACCRDLILEGHTIEEILEWVEELKPH